MEASALDPSRRPPSNTCTSIGDITRISPGRGNAAAEESLPGSLEGEPLQISFNPRYLTDGLDAISSDRVFLEFRDDLKPAVLRPAPTEDGEEADPDGDFLYLLMPVRV